jgi:hypothetical protein
MRNVDKTSLSMSGKIINIYKIEGLRFDPIQLFVDDMYEVVYRLGSSEREIESIYLDSTPDFRTIIFRSPHNMQSTVGIPSMNIISISKLVK